MQTSKALELSVKGAVADLQHKRDLENINATLTYDLAKLWKIIFPMLSPADRESLKDVQMAGQFTKKFTASGSYPAGVPSKVALRSLNLQGGLTIASLVGKGLNLQNFDLPIWGSNGVFLVAYSDKPGDYPQPAGCNGGQLSVSGATIDMTTDHPRLTMIPGTVAMRNVALNPALASAMGESLGNILFAGASTASGQATLTINQCNRLPLDNLVSQSTADNDSALDMVVSINDVELGSPNLNKAATGLSSALQLASADQY